MSISNGDRRAFSTRRSSGYHAYLLVDAGLATGADVTSHNSASPHWLISHLTVAGHDFADASRDEGLWKKATATVKDKAGSVSVDVMKQLLVSPVKSSIGL